MQLDYVLRNQKNKAGEYSLIVDFGVSKNNLPIKLGKYKLTKEGREHFNEILKTDVKVDEDVNEIYVEVYSNEKFDLFNEFGFLFGGNGSIKQRNKWLQSIE